MVEAVIDAVIRTEDRCGKEYFRILSGQQRQRGRAPLCPLSHLMTVIVGIGPEPNIYRCVASMSMNTFNTTYTPRLGESTD
jgi:hypothetical protein